MAAGFDAKRHHRRSIRLKTHNYAGTGCYFVTICIQHRACLLGNIRHGQMQLNDAGLMVRNEWMALPNRFPQVTLDAFVIMPNHFHSIVTIQNLVGATPVVAPQHVVAPQPPHHPSTPPHHRHDGKINCDRTQKMSVTEIGDGAGDVEEAGTRPAPTVGLGGIIGAFKSMTTHQYILGVRQHNWPPFDRRLWQRNYYEHIIRDGTALNNIRRYIRHNPEKWSNDSLSPTAPPSNDIAP